MRRLTGRNEEKKGKHGHQVSLLLFTVAFLFLFFLVFLGFFLVFFFRFKGNRLTWNEQLQTDHHRPPNTHTHAHTHTPAKLGKKKKNSVKIERWGEHVGAVRRYATNWPAPWAAAAAGGRKIANGRRHLRCPKKETRKENGKNDNKPKKTKNSVLCNGINSVRISKGRGNYSIRRRHLIDSISR